MQESKSLGLCYLFCVIYVNWNNRRYTLFKRKIKKNESCVEKIET